MKTTIDLRHRKLSVDLHGRSTKALFEFAARCLVANAAAYAEVAIKRGSLETRDSMIARHLRQYGLVVDNIRDE